MSWIRQLNRFQRLLLAAVIAGSILRVALILIYNPIDHLFSDPKRHWINGGRLFSPDLMGAGDPILYQVYIFLLRSVTADNPFLVALICGCLSAFMPWPYYRASRELGMSRSASLGVWALIASAPSLFTIYHYTMMETLLLPLVGMALWMSARHLRKRDSGAFLLSVFWWILACLTKSTVVPLAGVCLFYTWWTVSRRMYDGVLAAGVAFLMLLPNTLRTEKYLGFAAPFGNPWLTNIQHRSGAKTIRINFNHGHWSFSSPSCYMQPFEPLSPWTIRRALDDSSVEINIDSKNGNRDWKSAYENLPKDWKEWFAQLGENILLFLFAPSWPDNNVNEWDGWLANISRWMWAPIIFFVIECNIRSFLARKFYFIPVATTSFLLLLMFQNLATAEGRYRKPLEPLLIMNIIWSLSIKENERPSGTRSARIPSNDQ